METETIQQGLDTIKLHEFKQLNTTKEESFAKGFYILAYTKIPEGSSVIPPGYELDCITADWQYNCSVFIENNGKITTSIYGSIYGPVYFDTWGEGEENMWKFIDSEKKSLYSDHYTVGIKIPPNEKMKIITLDTVKQEIELLENHIKDNIEKYRKLLLNIGFIGNSKGQRIEGEKEQIEFLLSQ